MIPARPDLSPPSPNQEETAVVCQIQLLRPSPRSVPRMEAHGSRTLGLGCDLGRLGAPTVHEAARRTAGLAGRARDTAYERNLNRGVRLLYPYLLTYSPIRVCPEEDERRTLPPPSRAFCDQHAHPYTLSRCVCEPVQSRGGRRLRLTLCGGGPRASSAPCRLRYRAGVAYDPAASVSVSRVLSRSRGFLCCVGGGPMEAHGST